MPDLYDELGINPNENNDDLYSQLGIRPEQTGFKGVWEDVRKLPQKSLMKLINMGMNLPSLPGEVYGAGKQLLSDDPRAAENLVYGGLASINAPTQWPGAARDYLVRKELLPESTPALRPSEEQWPRTKEEFIHRMAKPGHMQGEKPGDTLLRNAAEFYALGGPRIVGGGARLTGKAISPLTSGVKNYIKEGFSAEKQSKAMELAKAKNLEQQGIIEQIKRQYAEQEAGLETPEQIARKMNERRGEIENLRPTANMPFEEIVNPEAYIQRRSVSESQHLGQQNLIDELKKQFSEQGEGLGTPEQITRKINNLTGEIEELSSQANIPQKEINQFHPMRENAVPQAMKNVENQSNEIAFALGKGKALDVDIAPKIQSGVESIKKQIQKEGYTPATEWAEKNSVEIPLTTDMKAVEADLDSIKSNPMVSGDSDFDALRESLIEKHTKSQSIKVDDLIKQWKETKQGARLARQKGFKEAGENQIHWQRAAQDLEKVENTQVKYLKSVVPEELMNKLLEADSAWAKRVIPFYGNKLYESTKTTRGKPGRVNSKNIAEELRGHGEGNIAMRQLIMSDPEMARMALGHTFAKNPERLLNLMPYEKEFLDVLPDVKQSVEKLRQRKHEAEIANTLNQARQIEMRALAEHEEQMLESQKKRQHAIQEKETKELRKKDLEEKRNKLSSALNKGDISEKEFKMRDKELKEAQDLAKEQTSRQTSRKEAIEKMEKLDSEVDELGRKYEKLKSARQKGEITEKEYLQKKEEFDRRKEKIKNLKLGLGITGTTTVTGMALNYVPKTISKLLSQNED